MKVQHATHRDNVDSIRENGLLAALATGRMQAVWLHSRESTHWAILHVAERHKWDIEDVVIFDVEIAPGHLCWRQGGIAWCRKDIPAEAIGRCRQVSITLSEVER